MEVKSELSSIGFVLKVDEKDFAIEYPSKLWERTPLKLKEILLRNFAYLATVEPAMMRKQKRIKYDTSKPEFKKYFDFLFRRYFPYSGDADCGDGYKYLKQFESMKFVFDGLNKDDKTSLRNDDFKNKEFSTIKTLNTLTFGKESLLGYGLSLDLGLEPQLVTIVEPEIDILYRGENIKSFTFKHHKMLTEKFEKEFGVKVHKVLNESANLRLNVLFDLDDTDLGSANVITEFMLLLMPFAEDMQIKYLIFGNEQSCDNYYVNKQGLNCYGVYDQSSEWTGKMNSILKKVYAKPYKITSWVEPLQEIAISKILYQRYPHLAKYQMSCHADNEFAQENRWCGHCSKCARCFVFMKAFRFDPASVGLNDMLTSDKKSFFPLFGGDKEMCPYDQSGLSRDEQLFAFYLATKNGASGDLIDLFKKEFYAEAESRSKELQNTFLKVYTPKNIPKRIWKKLRPLFEQELCKDN